jgi:6-phosphogluconolactonase/glucosamine-6-phosphate isomerase/deaminase
MKIIKVKNPEEGVEVCKKLLYEMVSKGSVLFLSGGSTPKVLYQKLAKEKRLKSGAVALVDERYFSNLKLKTKNLKLSGTNEFMIRQTGLAHYLEKVKTRFYPILENKEIEETTRDYDETTRYLFNYFPKSIGILGVGVDGHTAGLPAETQNIKPKTEKETDLVKSFDNFPGDFKERITLTFLGLSKLDKIIVLVFGQDKKRALQLMLTHSTSSGQESIAEIPSRFLNQKEITERVILITDQAIK